MRNYNEQSFVPEEVESGMLTDLLNYLISYNKKSKDSYCDIHILTDGYCQIVQWIVNSYSFPEDKQTFEFVDDEHCVMLEKSFPDNSMELFFSEDEYKVRLEEWLKENPGWERNEFGNWYNVEENEKIKANLGLL